MTATSTTQALRAARAFERYVRYVWPLHRRLVGSRLARRCRTCAASERMVPLDETGRCAECGRRAAGEEAPATPDLAAEQAELDRLLRAHQGRGSNRYDALVPYSGGKDSTYLIRRVQEQYPGLRLLAFTIDNGFMSSVAKENVAALVPQLAIDHLFVRPRRSFYVQLFRYCLTHLNAEGGYGTLDFSDGEFMLDTGRTLAAEKRIPLILCGYSRYQVENGLKLRQFESPREREVADRVATAGIPLGEIFSGPDLDAWWHGSRWPAAQVARLLFPLYAWNLEEAEIKRQVVSWGLLDERRNSPIATNHQLIPLLGVVDVHRFGYSSFEVEFCRMIRDGKADRREWQHIFELLEYSSRTGRFVKATVLESLAQLGLTTADVGIEFA